LQLSPTMVEEDACFWVTTSNKKPEHFFKEGQHVFVII